MGELVFIDTSLQAVAMVIEKPGTININRHVKCEVADGTTHWPIVDVLTSATPDQVAQFMDERYTVTLDEVRCRFYETTEGQILCYHREQVENWSSIVCTNGRVRKALLSRANIPVMSWADCQRYQGGKFDYPLKGRE